MDFPLIGTGKRLAMADYQAVATRYSVPLENLRAVVKVEAAGSGWSGGKLIKSLYEGHVMYRNAVGGIRTRLANTGLAWRRWDRKRYARGTRAQHDRIRQAVAIASDAGFKAASYGLPQVLGENHKMCGFAKAADLVEYMLRGEAEQLDVMMRFVRGAGLLKALQAGQWQRFARGYNGPGYKKNRYDRKLAAAVRLYRRSPADGFDGNGDVKTVTTRPKAPDPNVKMVQAALNTLIEAGLNVDGWPGQKTQAAVLAFQRGHPDLANDGLIGPQTIAAIESALEHKAAKPAAKTADKASASITSVASVGAAATASAGLPWQVGAALAGIAVLALVGWLLYRWKFAQRFDQERAHETNMAADDAIEVEAWADRDHEFQR